MRDVLILAASVVALACAVPVAATIHVKSYSGTITDSFDQTAMLSSGGSALDGVSFSAVFTYDTGAGSRYTFSDPLNHYLYDNVTGGRDDNSASPVSAVFKIGGTVISDFNTPILGAVETDTFTDNSYASKFVVSVRGPSDYNFPVLTNSYLGITTNISGGNGTVDDDFAGLTPSAFYGGFGFSVEDIATQIYSVDTHGSFIITATTFTTVPDAVPEPAAWALMITGFGLVGAAARRRRTALTA